MEIGSRVKVTDGSWSLRLNNNKFEHAWGVELFNREFEVLNINMKLPAATYGERNEEIYNDTVIKDINNNEIIFIQERFLKKIPKSSQPIVINVSARINPDDINEIKSTIDELENRLHNLKVKILL